MNKKYLKFKLRRINTRNEAENRPKLNQNSTLFKTYKIAEMLLLYRFLFVLKCIKEKLLVAVPVKNFCKKKVIFCLLMQENYKVEMQYNSIFGLQDCKTLYRRKNSLSGTITLFIWKQAKESFLKPSLSQTFFNLWYLRGYCGII